MIKPKNIRLPYPGDCGYDFISNKFNIDNLFEFLEHIYNYNKKDLLANVDGSLYYVLTNVGAYFIIDAYKVRSQVNDINYLQQYLINSIHPLDLTIENIVWREIVNFAFTKQFEKLVKLKAFI